MSTMDEISTAVSIFTIANCPFELMHCNSTYPMRNEDANLRVMSTLREAFNCVMLGIVGMRQLVE